MVNHSMNGDSSPQDNEDESSEDDSERRDDSRLGIQIMRRDRAGRYATKSASDPHGWYLFPGWN